jgi:curved DNA-binding protein CbpA
MRQSRALQWLSTLLSLCLLAAAQEAPGKEESESTTPKTRTYDFDIHNTDWGTYHDPQNIFCGKYDCYRILGFDYETFGSPDYKVITQHYRALSREWHPDKSKHKDAKERFVKIARAYEVLSNRDVRKEYDELRYDVEKYFMKYGASVLWNYAPQSDTTLVILILLIGANVIAWYVQKHRWQMVADRLIKAAVEDWVPSQGGTPESKELREHALAILEENEAAKNETSAEMAPNKSINGKKQGKKGKEKLSGKEKKRLEQEALEPIIVKIVSEMKDFGGGFHQPTWRDLFIFKLIRLPISLVREIAWLSKYYFRRLRKMPFSEEEKMVLTERAVGPITWDTSTDEQRAVLAEKELWIVANFAEWTEEQEFEKLSNTEKKLVRRMKKRGIQFDGDMDDKED